jgi:DHA2 family multidrug resistance protein
MTTVAFTTLASHRRSEGTSIFNLLRNVGSSIGIAGTSAILTHNTQVVHESLVSHIVPYGGQLHLHAPFSFTSIAGLTALNHVVTQQATMIAYNDDFKLMSLVAFAMVPFVLLMRPRRRSGGEEAVVDETVTLRTRRFAPCACAHGAAARRLHRWPGVPPPERAHTAPLPPAGRAGRR